MPRPRKHTAETGHGDGEKSEEQFGEAGDFAFGAAARNGIDHGAQFYKLELFFSSDQLMEPGTLSPNPR
jgi:hypothetical protein